MVETIVIYDCSGDIGGPHNFNTKAPKRILSV
jgi:hypothetical protein